MTTERVAKAASELVCAKEDTEHGDETSAPWTATLESTQQLSKQGHGSVSPSVVMPTVSSMVIGMLSSVVVAALVARRWGLPVWSIMQAACQLSLFVLGCWVLPRDHSKQPGQVVRALGTAFTLLRMTAYLYVALKAPPHTQKLLSVTWSYPLFGLYAAESTLLQALWHRLLPSWVCNLLGVWQASCFTVMSYRLTSGAMPWWRILHLIITPQVGMFAPYHLLAHPRVQQLLHYAPRHKTPTARTATGKNGISSRSAAAGHGLPGQTARSPHQPQAAAASTPDAVTSQRGSCTAEAQASAGSVPVEGSVSQAQMAVRASKLAHVHALQQKPYQSRLRVPHMVCVKLDTSLPCSSLPPNMALQLQNALRTSIGCATSLSIGDVAVRPGCICITMEVEEELSAGTDASAQGQLQPEVLARTLLPELQRMLSTGVSSAVQRSNVQVDDSFVTCVWSDNSKAWEVCEACTDAQESGVSKPWLGVTTVHSLTGQSASTSSDRFLEPAGQLGLLAEVQLWGVSKVADVEGWTPPQQHQDSELQWPGAQQPSGSSPAMKLLARAAGGYLRTQVVRLVPGSTDGYVTAQVLIHVHAHQLVRHHDGGSPSTLLLMDLELWQNEVLLSSSPLLSLPATGSPAGTAATGVPVSHDTVGAPPAVRAWWWGASDSTVSKAMKELQQCAEGCMQEVALEGAPAAIQTYVQYTQDLCLWLLQVQRAACDSQLCLYGADQAKSAAGRLQQPRLPPAAVRGLGHGLLQYARHMGWKQVQRMITQQMRSVVQTAVGRGKGKGRWAEWISSLRAVVMGYPCHHDEQLYKQQLAMYLSRVLVVSSSATALSAVIWGFRALSFPGTQHHAYHALSWVCLHLAAVATIIRTQNNKGSAQQAPAPERMRSAYTLVTVSHIWRLLFIWCTIADNIMLKHAFQQPHVWAAGQLLAVLSEQVPASVVLPAPYGLAVSLLLEFPLLLLVALREAPWHPAVSIALTFLLSVGARIMLCVQLRRQIRASLSFATSKGSSTVHAKAD